MATMPVDKAIKVQVMLNKVIKPKPPLKVDGIIGPSSKDAIKTLQNKSKLRATGEIDGETAIVIVRALKTGKIEKEPPKKFIHLGSGRYVGYTEKEYERQRKKFISDLKRGPLREMRIAVETAATEWEHFDKLNRDQWFVSFCVEVTRSTMLPKKSVISKARGAYTMMESLANSGDFAKFNRNTAKSLRTVNFAVDEMRKYRSQMIDGGENWVSGLEATKWASFTFLSVFGAPVAGAALGAGALSTAVVGGAALKATETAAGEIGNWSAGKEKWTVGGAFRRVMVDGAVGAITGYLTKGASGGKHIVEAASAKLVARLAKQAGFKALSNKTLTTVGVYLLTEGAKSTLEGAIADAGKLAANDKKMSLEKFLENIILNFMKGMALGPVGKIIEKYTSGKKFPLSKKDKELIEKGVFKQVSNTLKGTTHIDIVKKEVNEKVNKLAEGIIAKSVGKSVEKIIENIYSSWKGPMSPKALEKAIRDEYMLPSNIKKYTDALSEKVTNSPTIKKKR